MRIKFNVDNLNIIQLGITISDGHGRVPHPISTWQFNFNFNIEREKQAISSIQLLQSAGINFALLREHGISPQYFAEKANVSGLFMNEKLTWICFHGCYDFAYMLKLSTNEVLPQMRDHFELLLKVCFPNLLDIKSFRYDFNLQGSLDNIAHSLGVKRGGNSHQAGSDSHVTLQIFFEIFGGLKHEEDIKEYNRIVDCHNNDIYGVRFSEY